MTSIDGKYNPATSKWAKMGPLTCRDIISLVYASTIIEDRSESGTGFGTSISKILVQLVEASGFCLKAPVVNFPKLMLCVLHRNVVLLYTIVNLLLGFFAKNKKSIYVIMSIAK